MFDLRQTTNASWTDRIAARNDLRELVWAWPWLALALAAAYLVLLAIHFGATVGGVYTDADAASAPVIGALFHSQGGVYLGNLGWYSTLLFELGTRWLPLHRQLWEAAPYAMALASVALSSWAVWRVAGRWAAALTAVVMVCAAPRTLQLLLSLNDHSPTWFTISLLGAFLILLQVHGRTLSRPVLGALCVVIGAVLGVNAASDPLVIAAGVVPFALAIAVGLAPPRDPSGWRPAVAGAVTAVVAVVAAVLTHRAMSALHVTYSPNSMTKLLADGDGVSNNIKLWWESVATLGNGSFFSQQVSFASGLAVACAALSIGALILLPVIAWRKLTPWKGENHPAAVPMRGLIVFWVSSAVLLTGIYLVTAANGDINSDRYLVGLIYAAAAVVPAVAVQRPATRIAALAGTCVFALAGVISMAKDTAASASALRTNVVNHIVAVAEQHHLSLGYAGYWEAAPVTWLSNLRVRVYPVWTCPGNHLCRFYLHFANAWYEPHGSGSFLLTDPTLPFVPGPIADLGRPSAVYHIDEVTMYVYPYDITTKIAPP